MNLSAVFVGTAGSTPTARRGLSSLLLRRGGDQLLFDCGEGTQRQLIQSVGLGDIEHLFVTHFHADHILGIPGMLKTFGLRGREVPMTIYGPPGLQDMIDDMDSLIGRLPFDVDIYELEAGEELGFKGYTVSGFDVAHRGRAFGFRLSEKDRPGHFDEAVARSSSAFSPDRTSACCSAAARSPLPTAASSKPSRSSAKRGADARSSTPATPRRATATVEAAKGADLLVHESTFGDDEVARAKETNHSTARQAAEVARDAGVEMLCLTHVSGRYFGKELRERGTRGLREHGASARLRRCRASVSGARNTDFGQRRLISEPTRRLLPC